MIPSPCEWNYRNHVQFHLTRRGKIGVHPGKGPRRAAYFRIHLPETFLNELWPSLEFDPDLGLERCITARGHG